ncbi:hypothetical protein BDR05DRAFT_651804 [Suillus weaverae]|nr:hypothetical protein BDR05DRAFT_651804 [Suillus weaverae]
MSYSVIFFVQCFYAHRVWISESFRIYEGRVSMCSFSHGKQSLDHRHNCRITLYTRSSEVMFSTKWSPTSAFTGALCDSVVTGSIWLFMRPARTGNVRRKSRNYISEMMWIFINMGLFSCIVAITMAVLYMFQNGLIGQFYTAAPGAVIGKSYMNSMMAVLNARKSIRERERLGYNLTELPTIPTIR